MALLQHADHLIISRTVCDEGHARQVKFAASAILKHRNGKTLFSRAEKVLHFKPSCDIRLWRAACIAWAVELKELDDMRIDAGSYFYSNAQASSAKASPGATSSTSDAASALAEGSSSHVSQTDFTNMTRQGLFDWMNGQIRSGAMSLKDSSSFLGMTVKLDSGSGKAVDMVSDSTRINFMQRASDGLAGAQWRGDAGEAARLQSALDTMQRYQGQVTGVDIRA